MKRIIVIVVIFILGIFAFTAKGSDGAPLLSYSPCDTPLTYRIGSIDPRFNLSRTDTASTIKEATALWNQAWKTPIFIPDPKGEIVINLVYDQRQMLSSQINQIQSNLDSDKNSLDPQVIAYQQKTADFEKKMADLNSQIAYWNTQGGAPQDTYNQLKEQQSELQSEADELNSEAASLNQSTKAYNTQIKTLNQTVGQLDQTLISKPEEGIYNPNDDSISVYFDNTHAELLHTIAHELGHARGLEHNPDPSSIMYASSTQTTALSSDDIAALQTVCVKKSIVELYWNDYVNFVKEIRDWVVAIVAKK